MDAAAGHDGHVAVIPHEKVVIDQIGQAALAEDHGDVDRLVLGARLDDDVNAVLVGLGHDVDVGGGVPARLFAVGPDVIGPLGDGVQLGHLLQEVLLNGIDHSFLSSLDVQRTLSDRALHTLDELSSRPGRMSFRAPSFCTWPSARTTMRSAMFRMRS